MRTKLKCMNINYPVVIGYIILVAVIAIVVDVLLTRYDKSKEHKKPSD